MKRDIEYYLSLNYPIECYGSEHEIGDAFLASYIDFNIKGSGETPDEAVESARENLIEHIKKELKLENELPNPNEGVNFMKHREALKAYKNKNFKLAFEIWENEIKYKNDQAMTNLALMYLKGEGVEKNFAKAKEFFQMASEYGNESANYNLALMYQSKIGVEEDLDKAKEYFRLAVKKNHTGANFRLALLLLKNREDIENLKEGFKCMLSAGLNGYPIAKAQIGGIDAPVNKDAKRNTIFRNYNFEKQLEIVEDAIDRYIRPILIKDGGNIILIDYINRVDIEIRLAYQGNCAGCSLAQTSTYDLIKGTLEKVIDENIKVYVI